MRGIVKNHKASTIFVLAALAALSLSTAPGLATAKSFSNSGNYLVNDQNCTAGTCSLSSSNTVTSGSSGATSPPPSTAPTPTTLTFAFLPPFGFLGTLKTDTGPVADATITFTTVIDGQTTPITTSPSTVVTDSNGHYQAHPTGPGPFLAEPTTVTARFAGAPAITRNALAASSASGMPPP
jgi:hypothetical protein